MMMIIIINYIVDRAMAKAVSLRPVSAGALVGARVSLCGICG
jgi:hypothetical protein